MEEFRFPAHSSLFLGILQPGFRENQKTYWKFPEFCNPTQEYMWLVQGLPIYRYICMEQSRAEQGWLIRLHYSILYQLKLNYTSIREQPRDLFLTLDPMQNSPEVQLTQVLCSKRCPGSIWHITVDWSNMGQIVCVCVFLCVCLTVTVYCQSLCGTKGQCE